MTAQEARQIYQRARLQQISTKEGASAYSSLIDRVRAAAGAGENLVKATLTTRLTDEVGTRLSNDGYKYSFRPLGDELVSLVHISW